MYLLGAFYLTNGWWVRVGRLLRKLFFWGTSVESSTCQEVSGDQHKASNPLYEANLGPVLKEPETYVLQMKQAKARVPLWHPKREIKAKQTSQTYVIMNRQNRQRLIEAHCPLFRFPFEAIPTSESWNEGVKQSWRRRHLWERWHMENPTERHHRKI